MYSTLPHRIPKLLLLDGTGVVRRVWDAVQGEDTPERAEGALRSSWGSVLRGCREHEPTHFVAAFDHGGPTWRHRLDPHYKSGHQPPSQHLAAALPGFLDRSNAHGLRTLRMPDVEADDTIGTLAVKAASRGFEVVVLSTDKDMLALIQHGVLVYDHFQSEWRDEAYVQARFGISSRQMTDFLALMGDETDGIPGIAGIGPKTAARLLNTYGSLKHVLAAAPEIRGKLGERLRGHGAVARLSYELATLKTDVPMILSPRDIQIPASLVAHLSAMPAPRIVPTSPMLRIRAVQDSKRIESEPIPQHPSGTERRLRM